MICVGIDPGVTTGYAVWDAGAQRMLEIVSGTILEMMERHTHQPCDLVIFEDARQHWTGRGGAHYGSTAVLQGVGSVKRDCGIWEEFLTRRSERFIARNPHVTKLGALYFKALTGWQHSTNEHSRDAAMIVAGMNDGMVQAFRRQHQQNLETAQRQEQAARIARNAKARAARSARNSPPAAPKPW